MVKEKLIYSYVEAVIVISNHRLIVKRDEIIEHIFEYLLPFIE